MPKQDSALPFWSMQGIGKKYGGVIALDNVDFQCERGQIHAIIGENGAGKSTLIKIMSGVVQPSAGRMFLEGREVAFGSPQDATGQGVVCVFQELSLLPDLSVEDNICITDSSNSWGFINPRARRRRARRLLERVGCGNVHPMERVKDLPLSRRQMVEIAKALGREPKMLVLDEATSALTAADVEKVYRILERLRDDGLAIVYISHRMHEIKQLADRCSVFRNGRHIETFDKGAKTDEQVVELMIGREYKHVFPAKPQRDAPAEPMLQVEGMSWGEHLHDISFSIGKGEIVGMGGLDGQGQRELLLALFGVLRGVTGTITIKGRPVNITSPRSAKSESQGIALIPEDRKTVGLMLPMSVRDNISMASIGKLTRGIFVDRAKENEKIGEMIAKLSIRVDDIDEPVATLSGGNQQKVVIAKWLMTKARIILLNDPTRGIDVGTKQEMYKLLRELADAGTSILFYSTDYDELIGCCDQVVILYGGRIVRRLRGDDINEHNIIAGSLNLAQNAGNHRETVQP